MSLNKPSLTNRIKLLGLIALLFAPLALISSATAHAQVFISGSTGADGALDFSNLPAGSVLVFDPKKFNPPLNPASDNIFNFTTINIPAGITVKIVGAGAVRACVLAGKRRCSYQWQTRSQR
jgi:hypothetical protein